MSETGARGNEGGEAGQGEEKCVVKHEQCRDPFHIAVPIAKSWLCYWQVDRCPRLMDAWPRA